MTVEPRQCPDAEHGYKRHNYSPLNRINKGNVKRLVPGLEHQPAE